MNFDSVAAAVPFRRRVCEDYSSQKSLTEQAHAKDCDIHNILRRFEKTGLVTHLNKHQGQYLDFIGAPDFLVAQQKLAAASSMFESVPSKIRAKFDNSPAKFLSFMQNPRNIDEIQALGFKTSYFTPEALKSVAPQLSPVTPSEQASLSPKST